MGDKVEVELWADRQRDRQTDRQTEELWSGVRGMTKYKILMNERSPDNAIGIPAYYRFVLRVRLRLLQLSDIIKLSEIKMKITISLIRFGHKGTSN